MSKFTLFTLFLSSIIIVIAAEVMVNEYLDTPYSFEGATNVFQTQNQTKTTPSENGQETVEVQNSSSSDGAATQFNDSVTTLNTTLFSKAGIEGYTVATLPFAGKLFGTISIGDFAIIPGNEITLSKDGSAKNVGLYEFNPGSIDSAKEFYTLVKQRSEQEIGVILNETNSFGDASFYVNSYEQPEKVFLVFRKGSHVFGFNYPKEMHAVMSKLVSFL